MRIGLPPLVEQRALANGGAGQAWIDALPSVLDAAAQRWGLTLGDAYVGGTAGYVCRANTADGVAAVLKVPMPLDMDEERAFAHSVSVHRLAAGKGCVELIDADLELPAMLLEQLGPNLDELQLPLEELLTAVADTMKDLWRPMEEPHDLQTGADKAEWLAAYIVETWEVLEYPCSSAVIERAVALCERRASAHDDARAGLCHGDAHGWNTVAVGDGSYKFVDPEGVVAEPAFDLAVVMREYNEPLLEGDTPSLVRRRAAQLATRSGVDPDAVWEWGFIERVSTGLANLRDFGAGEAAPFLAVAERSYNG